MSLIEKEVVYEENDFVVLKIRESIMTNSDGKLNTSYLPNGEIKVLQVQNNITEVEYYIKQKKLFYDELNQCKYFDLKSIEFVCNVIDKILSDTIANEDEKQTNTVKFNDIKSFAAYIKALNDVNLSFVKEKIMEV